MAPDYRPGTDFRVHGVDLIPIVSSSKNGQSLVFSLKILIGIELEVK